MNIAILALGALIFLAHLFGIVFQRTRVPDVLLLIVLGVLLGPVAGVVRPEAMGQVGQVLSGLALVVILFESGTTTDLGALAGALRPMLRLTLVTFVLTAIIAGTYAAALLGLPPLAAAVLGCIVGGSSSAVVIPLAKGLGLGERTQTVLVLESAVTDVLCIVTVFGVVDAAGRGSLDPFRMLGAILASMLFAALLGVAGGVAWMRALPLVRRIPNTIAASVAFVLLVYGVTDVLGFSGGIAALAFGVTLTNHERFHLVESLVRRRGAAVPATLQPVERQVFAEAVFLLKTLFFVYLGVSFRFGNVQVLVGGLVVTLAIYLGRLTVTQQLLDRGTPVRDAVMVSVMVPKGLAAAVLASIPLQAGIAGGELVRDVTYAIVFYSILATAVLAWASEREPLRGLYQRVFRRFGAPSPTPATPVPAG
ncbi:MAG: hypothetical protein A2083_06915 [Gemmatimonadetes bacterium GWC2_71_9]|nr:MAG: hypothetical protein A2083_06915 [Gemmatimonadetes bacterium GWC2_71_9]